MLEPVCYQLSSIEAVIVAQYTPSVVPTGTLAIQNTWVKSLTPRLLKSVCQTPAVCVPFQGRGMFRIVVLLPQTQSALRGPAPRNARPG